MNTTTRIPEGARVLYIGGGDEHNASLVGRFGIVAEDDGTTTLPYYVRFETTPRDTWWCPAEALLRVPAIGDKVIPLPTDDGDWLGIPEGYQQAVGTVTNVDVLGGREVTISAEFRSYQKPDDTVRWHFRNWKPAVTLADVMDGHTLTVSDPFVPFVTGVVTLTGYLDHDGIHDMTPTRAVVSKVEGDIYTVLVDEREYVTGPGYVLPYVESPFEQPATPVEPAIITDLQNQIDTLTRELARANERVAEYADRAGKWERDFMRSWQRVGREATERAWCSEYERVVDDVQDDLEIGTIPPRIRLVEKRVRIRGEVYRDVTVWVAEDADAGNPDNWYASDDLDDACSEDFMTDQIDSEYSNNGWDDQTVTVLR